MEDNQSSPQSTLPTKCSISNCIMRDDDAQCQDPIHQENMDIECFSTRDIMTLVPSDINKSPQATSTRKRKSSNRTGELSLPPPIQRTPKATRTPGARKHIPMRPYNLPEQMSHTDATSKETWIQFNPRLHKKIGWSIIKMKSWDNMMGTLKECHPLLL